MEQWKELRLNPLFKVSNYGNVVNLKQGVKLISTKHSSGNEIIQGVAFISGRKVAIRLDKVVYQYFVNDVDFDKYDIIHKDGDKSNCHFKNLGIKPKTSYLNRAYAVYKKAIKRSILNNGYKKCSSCKDIKPSIEFYFHVTHNKLMSACRKCQNKRLVNHLNNKSKENPFFKLIINFRQRTTLAIKQKGYTKKSKTKKMLGCEWEFLKEYLENQFTKGMNWDISGS